MLISSLLVDFRANPEFQKTSDRNDIFKINLKQLRFFPRKMVHLPSWYSLFKDQKLRHQSNLEICSKLMIKTPERSHSRCSGVFVFFLLTLNKFHTLFWCFYCWHWTSKWWIVCFSLYCVEHFMVQINETLNNALLNVNIRVQHLVTLYYLELFKTFSINYFQVESSFSFESCLNGDLLLSQ